ncbi:MAG TPA: hypothetical protein VGO43_14385 [Pyrinomonadaceae bacterium]|jgi:hypothetical protein|nr:hypothetical protein [Pyrinomonadaceae bacterium]
MAKTAKRPSKAAKAAKRIVSESKLLATKAERDTQSEEAFKASEVSPRTNTVAKKPRPNKKRG